MSTAIATIHPEGQQMLKPQLKRPDKKWQKTVWKFMDSPPVQLFLIGILMMSLFMADSFVAGNAPDSQIPALNSILIAIFIVFMIESFVLSFVQAGYFLSFFFWMDVLGTISILLDITWVASGFLGNNGHKGGILRATRAAKLGARYGRLMRLLKLMRFLRYLPCFKQGDVDEAKEPTMSAVRKVSNELSSVLSMRVAALVMLIVIVVPFLSVSVTDYSTMAWLDVIKIVAKNTNSSYHADDLTFVVGKFRRFYTPKTTRLQYVHVESPLLSTPIDQKFHTRPVLRSDAIVTYSTGFTKDGVRYNVMADIDVTIPNQFDAMYGIILILLVIFVLIAFSASFNNAVEKLVVAPLEKMMNTLRKSATVMLKSFKAMEKEDEKNDNKEGDEDDDDLDEELETAMLEKMVDKLARIVSHMMPAEMEMDKNMDKATAAFLAQNYTTGGGRHTQELAVIDEDAERIRLQDLASQQTVVSLAKLNSWEFDVLDYNNEELMEIITYMFAVCNFFEEFKIPMVVFQDFLKVIASRYINTNTYHNFKHGCDVCHTVYRLADVSGVAHNLSTLEHFAILVAALGHDVGHPGVNNVFLVKAKDELALRHNDRSPLENMHCTVLYEALSKQATNIFVNLSESQWRESRKIILMAILGTDMSHHFEQISKTQLFFEVNGEDTGEFCRGAKDTIECLNEENNRHFVMELLLHCADISNPYKPWTICERWAYLVVEEFSLQGDREKAEGLEVSPMMDRNLIVLCNMQMGFIEFVVAPLIIALIKIFPPLYGLGDYMAGNYAGWGEKRKLEFMDLTDEKITLTQPERTEECRKLDERIGKFKEKFSFLEELKSRPQRKRK